MQFLAMAFIACFFTVIVSSKTSSSQIYLYILFLLILIWQGVGCMSFQVCLAWCGFSLEEMEDSLSAHSFILSLCLSVTKKHLLVYFSSIYLSVLDICSAFFLQYIFLFKGVSCGSYSVSQLSLVQCNLSTRFSILNDQNALCLVFPFTACFMQ